MLSGLASVNIELTSRCNKACDMCNRRTIEEKYPELSCWGDMEFGLVQDIARQLPPNIMIQFHNNGEPLLYPRIGDALILFKHDIRCFNTNGKLLMEKADDIIDNCDVITVSMFRLDPEQEKQFEILREFLAKKKQRKPNVVARVMGNYDSPPFKSMEQEVKSLGLLVARRKIYSPRGGYVYLDNPAPVAEVGYCLDFMHHLSIQRDGSVSHCVNFDPLRKGVLGNLNETTLDAIWNGELRKLYRQYHLAGQRKRVPLCETCEYWGFPE